MCRPDSGESRPEETQYRDGESGDPDARCDVVGQRTAALVMISSVVRGLLIRLFRIKGVSWRDIEFGNRTGTVTFSRRGMRKGLCSATYAAYPAKRPRLARSGVCRHLPCITSEDGAWVHDDVLDSKDLDLKTPRHIKHPPCKLLK